MTADVWDGRAEAYRHSEAHSHGADLDLLVDWAEGARTALDVGSGGGHVARRLREAGLEVVTVDPAPGMKADIVVFDPTTIRDKATYFEPFQYSEGINFVLVNGAFVVDLAKPTAAKPGKVLVRQRSGSGAQ